MDITLIAIPICTCAVMLLPRQISWSRFKVIRVNEKRYDWKELFVTLRETDPDVQSKDKTADSKMCTE